jgi:predicted glycosyltransferase
LPAFASATSHVNQVQSNPGDVSSQAHKPRVALYSHDTMGLGHLRRNLLIADQLSANPVGAETLILAGATEAAFFARQAGIDCVTLPALKKDQCGHYSSRTLGWSFEQVTHFRSQMIATALSCFQPDVFIVDKVPRGVGNELDMALRELRRHGRSRCVLGLRDVLDDRNTVQREWQRDGNDEAVDRFYDEVWIYGDPSVYDGIGEHGFSPIVANKALHTGYLDQTRRMASGAVPCSRSLPSSSAIALTSCTSEADRASPSTEAPIALCVVGGGQDGFAVASAFLEDRVPAGWRGVMITGPCMPADQRERLQQMAAGNPEMEVIDRLVEADQWLARATRVIAMGGYNTITSILSFEKPALVIPRISPRREQWIRAERLAHMGWLSVLSPADLRRGAIRSWLERHTVPQPHAPAINLSGLHHISRRVAEWLPRATASAVNMTP